MTVSRRLGFNILLFAFVAVNVGVWWRLTTPYRMFPADDVTLIGSQYNPHIPVFVWSMRLVRAIWDQLSPDIPNALLIQALIANGAALGLLGALIFFLSGRAVAAFVGVAIFMTSAWASGYYLMASYAPLAGAIALALLFCLLMAAEYEDRKWFAAFGFCAGLLFLTSSASPVLILCLFALGIWLTHPWTKPAKKAAWIQAAAGFGLIVLVFVRALWPIVIHLSENANTYHYSDANTRFGYIPQPPFFSFFYVASVSTPVITAATVAALFYAAYFGFRRRGSLAKADRYWLGLAAVVVAHTVILDLLPFTKLGRAHFPAFLISIVFLMVTAVRIFDALEAKRWRWTFGVAAVAIFAGAVYTQLSVVETMLHARLGPGRYLRSQPEGSRFYIQDSDFQILRIADGFGVRGAHVPDMNSMTVPKPGQATLFINGPHGPRSGRSVLWHSVLEDRIIDPQKIFRPPWGSEEKFPFYPYFPVFLMEEEISQALYFLGEAADMSNPDLQLTIWKF